MSDTANTRIFSQNELQQYLAGTAAPSLASAIERAADIDPSIAERIAALDPWAVPVREAAQSFPIGNGDARAQEAFERAAAETSPASAEIVVPRSNPNVWYLAGVAVLSALAAWGATRLVMDQPSPAPTPVKIETPQPKPPGQTDQTPVAAKDPTWRDAVASYVRLMTPETLTSTALTAEQQTAGLAAAAKHVGVDVGNIVARVPDLKFQRAEVLTLNGRPLVQLAFLDQANQVVAICVLSRKAKPESLPADTVSQPKPEAVSGQNIVSWDYNTHGFLVIGKDAPEKIMAIAQKIAVAI
jgi:hypothetical protein